MKKIIIVFSFLSAIGVLKLTAQTEAEMKAWQNYMMPGDVHKMIAQSDGEWVGEITMWMDPAAPPTKSTAFAKNEMIMGGRYQLSKISGDMMGMPFEGMSLVGYDNAKKTITNVWIDNFGTGILCIEGPWDERTKSITLQGKMMDPLTGKEIWTKQVVKFIDKDNQLIEMYDNKNGKETKNTEIKYTRKK